MALTPYSLRIQQANSDGTSYQDVVLDPPSGSDKLIQFAVGGGLTTVSDQTGTQAVFDQGTVFTVNSTSSQGTDTRTGIDDNNPMIPWATVQAAITKAAAEYTADSKVRLVYVVQGEYSEGITMANGVALKLAPGVVLNANNATTATITLNANGAAKQSILGGGVIKNTLAGGAIKLSGAFSNGAIPIIEGKEIGDISLANSGAAATVVESIVATKSIGAITLDKCNLDLVESLSTIGATTVTEGNIGSLKAAKTIAGLAMSKGAVTVDGGVITSQLKINTQDGGAVEVKLSNCGIKTAVAAESAIAIVNPGDTFTGTAKIILNGVILVSEAAATEAVSRAGLGTTTVTFKTYEAKSNKLILPAGITDSINSPMVVIDPDVESLI